jgi:type I restriction enzyme R subunit
MRVRYSEDSLVEQPAIELFKELGWEAANCYHETFGANESLGRETAAEVVLTSRLRVALAKLNPALPPQAIESAMEQLTRDRSAMSSVQANREIYHLLKNGVRVDLSGSAKRKNDEDSVVRAGLLTGRILRTMISFWRRSFGSRERCIGGAPILSVL